MGSMEDVTPQIEAVNTELRNIQEEKAKLEGEMLDLRRDKDEAFGELNRNVLDDFRCRKTYKSCIRSSFCLLCRNHPVLDNCIYIIIILIIHYAKRSTLVQNSRQKFLHVKN